MLQVAIGHSNDIDADLAIKEALEQCQQALAGATPQAGILFAAIDFAHQQILQKIDDTFPGIELIGCTTDGELSSLLAFQEDSLTLLLLASDVVEFRTGLGRHLSEDLDGAIHQAVEEARSKCHKEPKFCVITPESMTVSSSMALASLQRELGDAFPIFGGIAADQWKFEKTYQFYGTEVLSDSFPLLLFAGPIQFSSGVASGWNPIGQQGLVTKATNNIVTTIGDKSALAFYKYYLGDHITPSGEYPLAVFDGADDQFYLRAPLAYNEADGSITFAGDVPEGATVQLTQTKRDEILAASEASAQKAYASYLGEAPALALLISCAARKHLLGTRTAQEYEIIRRRTPDLPVFGFYAYGEIGPLQGGQRSLFHNETFITVLLGSADT